jgi:hypothetical protein
VRACAEVSSKGGLEGLVTSLGGLVPSASSSTAASSSLSPPSASSAPHGAVSSGAGVSKDVLAVILGSVFGAVVVFGFVVGCLVVRRRQRKILVVDGQG